MSDDVPASLAEALTEIRRLRARILELEAAAAMQRGTLTTMQSQQRDDGVRFTWNVPPSTPPMEIP